MTEVIYEPAEVIAVTIRISAEAEKRRDRLLKEGRCLGCEKKLESGEVVRRGQCVACYGATLRGIAKRRFTQSDMIREGKWLKRSKGGRKPTNPYTQDIAKRA